MARDGSYHKEDLRGDLIAAALKFVEEEGHHSLSVRILAQKVGVSPGAPYHHFPNRRSLLLAVAMEGFAELIDGAARIATSESSGLEKLCQFGMAFIRFATARPRLAALMYESELTSPVHDPKIDEFQAAGQGMIREAIRADSPNVSAKDIEIRAVAFWSAVYGFAALSRKNNIQSFDEFGMDRESVAQSVVFQAARFAADQA